MRDTDRLLRLLLEFFNLSPDTQPRDINQNAVASWDSLAMVQLIADLQGTFAIEFDLEEIDALRSYDEIRLALSKKGVSLNSTTA
jgi:acyl carrier protein